MTIETPRLLLRRLSVKEYRELFEQYSQEDAMLFLGIKTAEQYQEEKRKYDEGMATYRTSYVMFQLIEKNSGRVIGDCGFHTWHFPHFRAEIGYGLKEEQDKRQGYMTEALLAIVDYGFEAMKLNRIEAFVSPDNEPSKRLLQGLGFMEEGKLREHYYKDGCLHDSLIFGLLKKEYTNSGGGKERVEIISG